MNESQFNEINRKLNIIIRLLATQISHDKEYRDQVILLNRIGLKNKEIAEITGKSENNVKVTLHFIKRRNKEGKKNE